MDMLLPSKYIKVSYFWLQSAKYLFVQKTEKTEKDFSKFCLILIKPILDIIYELCQHLGSLR